MAVFTSKVDYALRALIDLAASPAGQPVQSREIAARQEIPESYLNQLMIVLRRAELVRSVRGAAGGYVLRGAPSAITAAQVVRVFHGDGHFWEAHNAGRSPAPGAATWVIRELAQQTGRLLEAHLEAVTIADLLVEHQRLNAAQSFMQGL